MKATERDVKTAAFTDSSHRYGYIRELTARIRKLAR